MWKVQYIKWIINWFVAVTILFGTIAAYYMAYRNSRPIKMLFDFFGDLMNNENDKVSNIYDFIANSAKRLMNDNRNLRSNLDIQMPILRSTLFNRILRGVFSSPEELTASLAQFGLSELDGRLAVLILQIDMYDDSLNEDEAEVLRTVKMTASNVLGRFPFSSFMYDIESNRTAIVLGLQNIEIEECTSRIEQICRCLYDDLITDRNISITIAVGNIVDRLADAYKSFIQAQEAMEYKMMNSNIRLIWYSDIPRTGKVYYYPPELELRLMHSAMAGELESVKRLLSDLYAENITNRRLSVEMVRQLLNNMNCTIVKLYDSMAVQENQTMIRLMEKLKVINCIKSIDEAFDHVSSHYMQICGFYKNNKKSHNTRLRDAIIAYVDSNYMDPELCVSGTAEKFNLSEAYLSQFFKEQTGQNFLCYLENTRIKSACELLNGTGFPVLVISAKVGYNSPHVFRNAFKRVTGINPTVYRNSIKSLNEPKHESSGLSIDAIMSQ